MNFFEKLRVTSQENDSLLCVGLDPAPSMIPDDRVVHFNHLIIKATAHIACAYKPNLAIYEAMGIEGLLALQKTIEFIHQTNPNIPIVGDAKRGDIGNCSLAYTSTLFDKYKFDAVTVNPYMGSDSLEPFLRRKDKGIFVLCRTSNPGGVDIQELMVVQKDDSIPHPLYEVVAELAQKWNRNGNVGLVVGATYPEQISRIRQICPDILFLIPGIGAQGGDIAKTVHNAVDSKGTGFIINVSRQIMYAATTSSGAQRSDKAAIDNVRHVANKLKCEINSHLRIPPKESQKQLLYRNRDKISQHAPPHEEPSSMAVPGIM